MRLRRLPDLGFPAWNFNSSRREMSGLQALPVKNSAATSLSQKLDQRHLPGADRLFSISVRHSNAEMSSYTGEHHTPTPLRKIPYSEPNETIGTGSGTPTHFRKILKSAPNETAGTGSRGSKSTVATLMNDPGQRFSLGFVDPNTGEFFTHEVEQARRGDSGVLKGLNAKSLSVDGPFVSFYVPVTATSRIFAKQTEFDSMTLRIRWEKKFASDVASFTTSKIRDLLTDAIQQVPGKGIQCLGAAVEILVNTLPFQPLVHIKFSDRFSSVHANVTAWKRSMTGQAQHEAVLDCPPMGGLPYMVSGLQVPSSRYRLRVRVTGRFPTLENLRGKVDEENGKADLYHAIVQMHRPSLMRTKFDSLDALAAEVAQTLLSGRHAFERFVEVQSVYVKVLIENGPSASGKATVESSKKVALPQLDEGELVDEKAPHGDFGREGVYIALGSNVGNRLENIERACREIDSEHDMKIIRTSSLYETMPMYVEDQDHFLNGVCEIRTSLQPYELLDRLQAIEQRLGRRKTIEKGPRNIDLDILLYRNDTTNSEKLTIPHPLMMEREFVLRPLCDIPTVRFRKPAPSSWSFNDHLNFLSSQAEPMSPITSLSPECSNLRPQDPKRATQIMSIINMTPDSFSDGGEHVYSDVESLKDFVRSAIQDGATIIDVGGQSSRPNAQDVSAEVELARVLPAVEAIKSLPEAASIAISVDTYRAAVADAAVKAGAHIINDISAGLLDPDMLPTIARLGCTYIMMHMRGTPGTMQSEQNCSYPDGLIPTVTREMKDRVYAAGEAGIRRWRLILDPGLGFAKTTDQNLEILRRLSDLKGSPTLRNLPWLVGSSRKSFIGEATGVKDPKERIWGTAATVTAAIQGGADIIRVHDVKEMATVAKQADALFRR